MSVWEALFIAISAVSILFAIVWGREPLHEALAAQTQASAEQTDPPPVLDPEAFFARCEAACGVRGMLALRLTRQEYAVVQDCSCADPCPLAEED